MQVDVKPDMLRWARERARISPETLALRFPRLMAWERREVQPTLRQVELFAKAVHTPIGYLFLSEPPEETLPIPDFRTMAGRGIERPSPDLLDMLYVCQQRQEWYRDFARSLGEAPRPFVGAAKEKDSIEAAAQRMRTAIRFDEKERGTLPTWSEALRRFIELADDAGIMVMCSGVVLNNNRRKLDPEEFRGFAMSDPLAPLVFINGSDTRAAQMFTLAHELAHIWLGQSAVSDSQASAVPDQHVERWCNQVAAEFLVPLETFRREYRKDADITAELQRLAKRYKVSTLVILRRMLDAGGFSPTEFQRAYNAELERILSLAKGSGGNFYLTQAARVSKRFARALVASTLEGQTLHRDAFRMLGFSSLETFQNLGKSLQVIA